MYPPLELLLKTIELAGPPNITFWPEPPTTVADVPTLAEKTTPPAPAVIFAGPPPPTIVEVPVPLPTNVSAPVPPNTISLPEALIVDGALTRQQCH